MFAVHPVQSPRAKPVRRDTCVLLRWGSVNILEQNKTENFVVYH